MKSSRPRTCSRTLAWPGGILLAAAAAPLVLIALLHQGQLGQAFVLLRPPRTTPGGRDVVLRGLSGVAAKAPHARYRSVSITDGRRLGQGSGGEAARRRTAGAGCLGDRRGRREGALSMCGSSDDNRSVEEEWPFHKSRYIHPWELCQQQELYVMNVCYLTAVPVGTELCVLHTIRFAEGSALAM